MEENGLKPEQIDWQDGAIRRIINDYTHEAGVRELERQIASVCRGIASQVARGKTEHATITPELVVEMLGPAKYVRETKLKTSKPGVVTGLAYTPAGGEVLHIEATRYPGKGNVTLTGHIGEVMKESVQAAFSLATHNPVAVLRTVGDAPDQAAHQVGDLLPRRGGLRRGRRQEVGVRPLSVPDGPDKRVMRRESTED